MMRRQQFWFELYGPESSTAPGRPGIDVLLSEVEVDDSYGDREEVEVDDSYGDREDVIALLLDMIQPAIEQETEPRWSDPRVAFINPMIEDIPVTVPDGPYKLSQTSVGTNIVAIKRMEPTSFRLKTEWLGQSPVMSTFSKREGAWYIFSLVTHEETVRHLSALVDRMLNSLSEPLATLQREETEVVTSHIRNGFGAKLFERLFGEAYQGSQIVRISAFDGDAKLHIGVPKNNNLCRKLMTVGLERIHDILEELIDESGEMIRVDSIDLDAMFSQADIQIQGHLVIQIYGFEVVFQLQQDNWCDFVFDVQGRSSADTDAPGDIGAIQAKKQWDQHVRPQYESVTPTSKSKSTSSILLRSAM